MKRGQRKKPALSQRKLAANRANARKSRGPKTAAGKKRSSRNGITHGIFAKDLLLPGENGEALKQFMKEVIAQLNPRNILELKMAERLVVHHWRLERIASAEKEMFLTEPADLIKQCQPEKKPNVKFDPLTQEPPEEEPEKPIGPETNRQRWKRWTKETPFLEEVLSEGSNLDWMMQPGYTASMIQAKLMAELAPDDPACALPIDPPPPPPNKIPAGKTLAMLLTARASGLDRLHHYERRTEGLIHRTLRAYREMQKSPTNQPPCAYAQQALETIEQSPAGSLASEVPAPSPEPAATNSCENASSQNNFAKAIPPSAETSAPREVVDENVGCTTVPSTQEQERPRQDSAADDPPDEIARAA